MKCIVSQYLSNYCSIMQWPVCSPPEVVRLTETEDINQILQQPTHFTPSHAARPGTAALQRDGYRVSVYPEHSPASALIWCLRIPTHPAEIQLPAMWWLIFQFTSNFIMTTANAFSEIRDPFHMPSLFPLPHNTSLGSFVWVISNHQLRSPRRPASIL